ncbi:hypothetical protein QYE76_020344 [Lolium multiflorum]|uniref:Retrotransposon Copia-like N-terminal domain-containing protein n=1 Tax=Lolium multiflorum TaxID=4521 RepID=A0AAD8R5Q3_LOLMU|nr:hypothetical protein QYE76_020344 [Lolium multiflorum]
MAGEVSTPTPVTSGELAAVLRAIDERYSQMFDALSKQQGGGARQDSEVKEEIHPLQMPLVKLEGSESYASWAEHAETILVSRKLEGYILGTVEKPAEEESKEGQRWRMTNALVRAWLLSSVSPKIAKQVERIKDASEIWRLLKEDMIGEDGAEDVALMEEVVAEESIQQAEQIFLQLLRNLLNNHL